MSEWKQKYDDARLELKRAEELLKQRHENTRKVLEKQKALHADLDKEKELRKQAETDLKKYVRENRKLVKQVSLLERRLLSLEAGGRVVQPQKVSVPSARAPPVVKKKDMVPSKRRIEEKNETKASKLGELLGHLVSHGDGITQERISMVASIVKSISSPWNQEDIVSTAYNTLMQCCLKDLYSPRLAPMTWAPCHWFPDKRCGKRNMYHGIGNPADVKSLVAMWCDEKALEHDTIPWLLKCMQILDQDSPSGHSIMRDLTIRAYDATLHALEDPTPSVTNLCCNATVTMALWRLSNDIRAAAVFIRDILVAPCHNTLHERMILVALSAALEVWPAALNRRSMGQTAVTRLETLIDNYISPPLPTPCITSDETNSMIMCHYAAIFVHAIL